MSKLRWGVLGASGIAKTAVVPAIQASRNGSAVAVASRNAAAAADWARSLSIETVFPSYDALLADPGIEAVYIPLPNSLHAEWTEKAARAGKAVLCEKPLATDAASARRAIEAGRSAGVPLMEGFMYRFHPQHQRVLSLIREGAIGDLVEVQVHLSVNLMSPPDPGNVRFIPALGGGSLLDMGCYTVSIARMIFDSEPVAVQARWNIDDRFGVDTDDAAFLDFGGGRTARLGCSFHGNGQGFYRVIGTTGLIDVPRAIILGLDGREGEALITVFDGRGARKEERIAPVDQYRLMVEAFADAVLEKRDVPYPPADSLRNMAVLDAIAQSARSEGARMKIGAA